MKRIICLALALLLFALPASAAGAPQLSGRLIPAAKQGAVCLASGEYERLVTLLPFSGTAPGADEWAGFARSYSTRGRAQTDYAVAYWTGDSWRIAVPLETPDNGGVEVLMLMSADGTTFSGYRYATWSQVELELHASDHVTWDREYVGGEPQVFVD